MAGGEERQVVFFCHWGGRREVKDSGKVMYQGGITEAFVVTSSTTYENFIEEVCERFHFELAGKVMYYSTKFDNSLLVRLSSQGGFDAMLVVNGETVDIYIEDATDVAVRSPLDHIGSRVSDDATDVVEQCPLDHISSRALLDDATDIVALSPPAHISLRVSDDLTDGAPSPEPISSRVLNDGCGTSSLQHDDLVGKSTPDGIKNTSHRDLFTGQGQIFESPTAFKEAVTLFALSNHFAFKYADCSPRYYRILCKVEGCSWKLTAGCAQGSKSVRVKHFQNVHNHTAEDESNYKPVIRSKELGRIIMNKVRDNPSYLPRQICKDFESDFTIKMSYMQGWRARKRATEAIGGPNDDSVSNSLSQNAAKRRPGRPRTKPIVPKCHDKNVIHCSNCHQAGHNRRNCNALLSG